MLHDIPKLKAYDITTTSFTLDVDILTAQTNPNYETPTRYNLEVTSVTQGSSFTTKRVENFEALGGSVINANAGFVFFGGEELRVTIEAVFTDSTGKVTDVTSGLLTVELPYEPIVTIQTKAYNETTGEWYDTTAAELELYSEAIYYDFSAIEQEHTSPNGNIIKGKNVIALSADTSITPSVVAGTRKTFIYSIEDTSIADVDDFGVIRAKKQGTTTLKIAPADRINTTTATIERKIKVIQPVEEITFGRTAFTMRKGEQKTFFLSVFPYNANNQSISYEIENTEIIAPTSSLPLFKNSVTALAVGETTITATAKGGSKYLENPLIATMTVKVIDTDEPYIWNDISECPKYLNANDFNIISDNLAYVYWQMGSPNIGTGTGTIESFPTVTYATGFADSAQAVKDLFHYGYLIAVHANVVYNINVVLSDISIGLEYAPNREQWNNLILEINAIKTALENQ